MSEAKIHDRDLLVVAAAVIRAEADALLQLADSLDATIVAAAHEITRSSGRLIVSGIGKSGHIARKVAATFASTGTSAMYVHPSEASHGDLGMIGKADTVIAISKSGESPELSDIVNYCRRHAIPLIAITAGANSALAKAARHVLLLPDIAEACPMGLAPTTSTTMALALGDALAIACLKQRDFRPANFREFHPGGKLGQKLIRVRDIMHTGDNIPVVGEDATVGAAILEMTRCRFGCVGILNSEQQLTGIFTDGDLRRSFSAAIFDMPITAMMTLNPRQIAADAMVADVANLFTSSRIPSVFVTAEGKPLGIVHVHDLLGSGFV